MSIPVIGTAVVKNPKWVTRLYESIDYPVDNFFVINNNGQGEITDELDSIKNIDNPFVKRKFITHFPSNIGVASSWNLIIKSFMMANYWVIVNDDVAFLPGILEELALKASDDTVGIINPFIGDFNLGAWDFFLIKDWVIQSHGLFDENLYPAYCEDADYIMRLILNPVKRIVGLDKKYLHGDGFCDEYYQHGSQTRKANSQLASKLEEVNLTNFSYMTQKWGAGWRTCSPDDIGKIKTTSFDLNFCREKYLGF